jgi:hypothetical protein
MTYACPLLAHHQANRHESALPVGWNQPALLLHRPVSGPMHGSSFFVELGAQFEKLSLDIGMLDGQMSDRRQDIGRLLPIILASQPSGRLWTEQHAEEDEQRREGLHSQRNHVGSLPLFPT